MSKCNRLFQDRQEKTMKDRYADYLAYVQEDETPMSLGEFASWLADEIRDRAKYE